MYVERKYYVNLVLIPSLMRQLPSWTLQDIRWFFLLQAKIIFKMISISAIDIYHQFSCLDTNLIKILTGQGFEVPPAPPLPPPPNWICTFFRLFLRISCTTIMVESTSVGGQAITLVFKINAIILNSLPIVIS